MVNKYFLMLSTALIIALSGFAQADSVRTKNDKPGTPQSLRTSDQSPQSTLSIINTTPSSGQTVDRAATGSNGVNTTIVNNGNVADKTAPTSPISIVNKPRSADSTVNNSAIQNGISNASKPIRNQ